MIQETEKKLWNSSVTKGGEIIRIDKHVVPHQTLSLNLPTDAHEIQYLEIKAAAVSDTDNAKMLRSTILNMLFDGYRTVSCPLSDFPGTGLEDYYNTSWAPVVLYQNPFANAPLADNSDSYGYNTFTRTRNLDAVPFDSSFRMNLEMLGWESGKADFVSIIYWYAFEGATDNCRYADAQPTYFLPE